MCVVPASQKSDSERRRQEISDHEAEIAAIQIQIDALDLFDEGVGVGDFGIAAGQDPVEAPPRAEAELVFVEVSPRRRVRKIRVGVARDDRG
jgi:hypothetical protein